jgi:hypothetical protein
MENCKVNKTYLLLFIFFLQFWKLKNFSSE